MAGHIIMRYIQVVNNARESSTWQDIWYMYVGKYLSRANVHVSQKPTLNIASCILYYNERSAYRQVMQRKDQRIAGHIVMRVKHRQVVNNAK